MSFCTSTRKGEMKKICFILFLVFELQPVTCCGFGEYEHQGECCPMCLAGNIVSKHCTVENGTTCKRYAAGEHIEHRNGLEKCFRYKACDQEQQCTKKQNTLWASREGYYCIDRSCETGRKHKTCPPGEGVKEKGTHFNDTVCEHCPPETYSNNASLTEACKVWTKCEELNQNQVKPGNSTHDVECEKKSNRTAIVVTVLIVVVLIVAVTATVLIWKKKQHKRHTDAEKAKAKRKNHREVPLMEEHEKEQYIPSVVGTPMPETRQGTANPNSNKTTGTSLQHQTAGDTSDSGDTLDSGIGSQSVSEINSPSGKVNADTRNR